jgi:hypothetical protein
LSNDSKEHPHSRAAQILHNRDRDMRVRAHQLHMEQNEKMSAENTSKQGYSESENPDEGIDQDIAGKVGHMAQQLKEKTGSMRRRILRARIRARSLAKGIV